MLSLPTRVNLLPACPRPLPPSLDWDAYYAESLNLWNQPGFLQLMGRHQFHPVKISWEDIGRSEMYESKASMEKGIKSVMRNAPEAKLAEAAGA